MIKLNLSSYKTLRKVLPGAGFNYADFYPVPNGRFQILFKCRGLFKILFSTKRELKKANI